MSASQKLPTLVPAGRSKATAQPLSVAVPPLVTVYLPSHPEPQSEVLTKVAVSPAAKARGATRTAVTTASSATTRIRKRLMAALSDIDGFQFCSV
jgi:hypothetical protein